MGTAHDCLEHFKGDTGSIDDEFQAFGCMLLVRGEQGYFRSPFYENIGSEVYNMWHYYKAENVPMKLAPKKLRNLNVGILETIREAKRIMTHEDEETYSLKEAKDFYDSWAYWMQIGYNRAKRKYKSPGRVCSVFQMIEQQVDKILKFAEEGSEVHITYDIKNVKVNAVHLDYYELHPEEY